jgi:aspartyl-tRNA(Asn)/glutamyl-tRNA(Gln) amidotransferase subunit A
MDIAFATAVDISRDVAKGEVSAREVTETFLSRIAAIDGDTHAFLHVDADWSLAFADAVDRKRAEGKPLGPLAGVPVAVKDVMCTEGVPTTCGSKILENYRPPYTSTAVERLIAADAVPIGKTNMDEFAMGSSTENSGFGPSLNPWDLTRAPGGSSGGSAVAVAARLAPVALGSDTGGSIRQPAALCGVVGMKPTYGRVSRYGLVAFASSLDQIGPFSTTVRDSARVLRAMSGHDQMDSTSLADEVEDYEAALGSVDGMRIGVPKEYFTEGLDGEVEGHVRAALATLEGLGARLHRRGFEQSGAVRRGPVRPSPAGDRGHHRTLQRNARGRLRGRGKAANHARNVRPFERVLRCLLSQGTEGAPPYQAGFRGGV